MPNNTDLNSDISNSYLNKVILVGVIVLLLVQLVSLGRLLFFRENIWAGGDYMIDKFGHTSLADIIFSFVILLFLLALVRFWRKHRLVVAACVLLWLRTAVGGGMWRYYLSIHDNVGQNLFVFDQYPWLLAVIGSSALGCLATFLFLVALIQGETLQALLEDWMNYLPQKVANTP
jgi:hypothetical protein